MSLTDYMCHEEREEEDLPALKTAWRINTTIQRLHRKARRKSICSHHKQYLQHKDQQNDNNQKNNCMDVLSDKQVTSHTRKRRRSKERETLRKKLNLF